MSYAVHLVMNPHVMLDTGDCSRQVVLKLFRLRALLVRYQALPHDFCELNAPHFKN